MTAHRLAPCCAAGLVRRDPYTGEERCENCGCPVPLPNVAGAALHGAESPEPVPPLVMGGQGRDASEVVDDGDGIVRVLIVTGFLVAFGGVAVWAGRLWADAITAAGGGR